MGTYYSIKYIASSDSPSESQLHNQIDLLLEEVNNQMSTYRPDSELSRFNQSREINQPFPVSAATVKVVNEAIRINQLSQGALDISVGPLVNLWGFGPEAHTDQVPTEAELEKRRAWVGMDKLKVEGNALVKLIPELYLDLSSIAKGYGVDAVAEYLESVGIENYLVDIGGEVRTRGINDRKQPWRIAIEKPSAGIEQTVQEVVEPGNISMATSGNYRNFFEVNGVRYSHTIDPRTGRPVTNNIVSITVMSPSCMTADGFSTALGVMGPEEGIALADKLGIPVMVITQSDNDFVEHYSAAFKAKVAIH
ncbi:Thiamine biosynthesis lipoprotein ApbE precursor [Pragia fontium]|uniref:FAD:protein FMN transferase n=3 Tax=Pragia fontium TaxID=82985 RepID=A0AAJ5BH91_9GAMM|nr:FAD:protein FMN transferase [Pragia fontium]SFC86847.1 thiamine biosynthesis lipoprotein [Pragia fontium DSM 5563 = ATCC 49100]SUB83197.1 Thiamine biosynthesis lipoprotein ApbE precursor [Pragia fontium]VEJ56092.1 Thiamine biosynthesis lipoprotein ApbE precursor [Pragia fontium]